MRAYIFKRNKGFVIFQYINSMGFFLFKKMINYNIWLSINLLKNNLHLILVQKQQYFLCSS